MTSRDLCETGLTGCALSEVTPIIFKSIKSSLFFRHFEKKSRTKKLITNEKNSITHSNEPSNDTKLVSKTDDNSNPSGMLNCTDASTNVVSETDDKSNITNEDAWIEKHRIEKSYVLLKKVPTGSL